MKIGILLPPAFDLGLLRRARHLALLVGECSGSDGTRWSATIGLPEPSERRWRDIERQLRLGNNGTVVRHLRWEKVPVDNARRMFAGFPDHLDLENIDEVSVPRDWGWNFRDCDAVIIFGDPDLGAILPLGPTIFYCPDLAVRIVPEAFADSIEASYWERQTDAFRIWRQSMVVTSDEATIDDIVSYAGVRRERIACIANPLNQASDRGEPSVGKDLQGLAWLMQPSPLHDLANAARGLQIYHSEGGLLQPFLVRDAVRGQASPIDYPYGLGQDLAEFIYGLPVQAVSSEGQLLRVLGRAGALWSSRVAGGEGEAALLAATVGASFLGADYAVNRTTAEAAGVTARLYSLDDPLAIADALHALEGEVPPRKAAKRRKSVTRSKRVSEITLLIERIVRHFNAG